MDFTIELPINQTGLGSIGAGIAIELFQRGLYPNLFLIGDVQMEPNLIPKGFQEWMSFCSNKALRDYKRDKPSIKLWFVQESIARLSDHATLYTVHETDRITDVEKNIMSQYDRVLVPSNFSKQVFESQGLKAGVCPNFYDTRLFSQVPVARKGLEGVTIFSILGKMEKRKRTVETIAAWVKRFGGDKKYRLNCHIFNSFLVQAYRVDPANAVAAHIQDIQNKIGMELPWNVTVFGFQNQAEYNLSLNALDIDLGLSGGEGFGLPLLQTRCLGKKGVALNAHAHKDFVNEHNSVLIEPSGVEDSNDGMFFRKGETFNQGNIFSWNEDEAIAGMEEALSRPDPDPALAEELKTKFSVRNTVDILLDF